MKNSTHCWIFLCFIMLSSCSELGSLLDADTIDYSMYCGSTTDNTAKKNIQVTWQDNPDKEVNSITGGYHLYYSTDSNFAPSIPSDNFHKADNSIESLTINESCAAPSTQGPYSFLKTDGLYYTLPNAAYIPLPKGNTYYFKVVAFSQYAVSKASTTLTIVVD
jgi:hypothetical protein